VLVRSAARSAPALAGQLHLAAASADDERPDGAWHTEWQALRNLLRLAGGAAAQLRELVTGLQVFPEAMRRNLELSGPLLLSEAVNAVVVPLLDQEEAAAASGREGAASGKDRLQAVMERALQAPKPEQGGLYARLLRETVPAEKLSDPQLESLLDPATYLGQARTIAARILGAYPDWARAGIREEKNA
jgi:3-carboxy-cis,cis-muconate cycloisomerase